MPIDCYVLPAIARILGVMHLDYEFEASATSGSVALGLGWDQPGQWSKASTWPSARSMDAPSRWSASRSGESATGDPGADGIVEALESLQTEGIGGDTGRQRRLLGNALGERK